jgi:zinc transport system ATP-binding protein
MLSIRQLHFSYAQQPVLENVSLELQHGGMLSVIGPNGGGKTTLVKLILGLLTPDAGTVEVAGMSSQQAVKRGDLIGYLPQQPTLNTSLPIDVQTMARLGLAGRVGLFHSPSRQDLAFVDWLLDRVQLSAVRHQPMGELSGGQQQRAMIARALAAKPKLLVLDEPTIGIDAKGQSEFEELIVSLRKDLDMAVLMVTHDLAMAMRISDRIACVSRTIHFHDLPAKLPPELARSMFNCDVNALRGLPTTVGDACNDPACDGQHGDQHVVSLNVK